MGRKSRAKLERRERFHGAPSSRASFWRRRWRRIAGGAGAMLLIAGAVAAWQQWNGAWGAPEPAPRFNLMTAAGPVTTLDDYLGKQEVVLIFYMGGG